LRATSKIKSGSGTDYLGVIVRVVVDKNRIVAPWKEVRLAIPFHRPLSRASGLLPLLIAWGVLETKGQFLWYQGRKIGRAYATNAKYLDQDEQAEALLDQIPELLETVDSQAGISGVTPAGYSAETTEEEEVEAGEESE